MKILLLDFNVRYLNRTRNLLPALLGSVAELAVFGPGYVPQSTLDAGLEPFAHARGPFDFVFVTEHFWTPLTSSRATTSDYQRVYGATIPAAQLRSVDALWATLDRVGGVRVASLAETDYYTLSETTVRTLDETFDLFLGWNKQLMTDRQVDRHQEPLLLGMPDPAWRRFVTTSAWRVIPFAHFVSGDEFSWTPLSQRRRWASVPGVEYSRRRLAKRSLPRSEQLRHIRDEAARKAFSGLSQQVALHDWTTKMLMTQFRRGLEESRFVYVDGSMLDYFVRKFVEVPAAGSVLICSPCEGFVDLGFAHERNCYVSDAEDFGSTVRELMSDLCSAQMIADRGRELVLQRHSLSARSLQLRRVLDRILGGNYRGAEWRSGDLTLS